MTARSEAAQAAVISQIVSGPLILSWLLSVFASSPRRRGTLRAARADAASDTD